MTSMTSTTAAAILAALCAATPAAAGSLANPTGRPTHYGPMTVQVLVSSRGLDLSSEAGARIFLHRLAQAAERTCNPRANGPALSLIKSPEVRACEARATAQGMAQVSSPLVRRLYAQASSGVRLARR
jgi:UrcA family protein